MLGVVIMYGVLVELGVPVALIALVEVTVGFDALMKFHS